jgi:hypothetical protein
MRPAHAGRRGGVALRRSMIRRIADDGALVQHCAASDWRGVTNRNDDGAGTAADP